MSMKEWAKAEMERAKFDQPTMDAMMKILDIFYEEWDSGGAVWAMVPVLESLLTGLPLSPLTGEDDEWMEVGLEREGVEIYQNVRCSTVFKRKVGKDWFAYDLELPGNDVWKFGQVTFPYEPRSHNLSPVVTI